MLKKPYPSFGFLQMCSRSIPGLTIFALAVRTVCLASCFLIRWVSYRLLGYLDQSQGVSRSGI